MKHLLTFTIFALAVMSCTTRGEAASSEGQDAVESVEIAGCRFTIERYGDAEQGSRVYHLDTAALDADSFWDVCHALDERLESELGRPEREWGGGDTLSGYIHDAEKMNERIDPGIMELSRLHGADEIILRGSTFRTDSVRVETFETIIESQNHFTCTITVTPVK